MCSDRGASKFGSDNRQLLSGVIEGGGQNGISHAKTKTWSVPPRSTSLV